MAQDEKKPRSRHCSVLLPLIGQRHHMHVWLGTCEVAHIPRGHHSCLTHHVPISRHFSLLKTRAARDQQHFLGDISLVERGSVSLGSAYPAPSPGQGCLERRTRLSLCSQTDDQASWLAISPSMLASTPWRVSAGLVTQDRARQATCPSGRTSTAPSCSTP
jgi:hypothetical protein